ncbi:MAG: glycosyltransferase family 4 protein [Drouetiella hepatica Uher 2000/2452]|jgi:glycosyltransferase involved in cell wall biosynthesis|uniref:Glycosyltransferase family 4 protein n=1 Tax=Drouetiella hepatica Uher 2000/2452 TaxID=904376 RepID=A0A951QED0_9CYAN|nr:glycosyltransferase family 4 protein [Drouetiella hepatica Uher 2000/2452]
MNILMISSTFPYPPTQGGTQVRTFNLLKYLQQHHAVTLLTLRSPDTSESEIAALREQVTELVIFPRPPATELKGWGGKLERFGNFLMGGTPPSVLTSYSPPAQSWVEQAVEANRFDVITCEHSVNEIYVRSSWKSRLRTIVNIHSSVYGTCKNQLETGTSEHPGRDRLNLPLLYRYEQKFSRKFSRIVVTTAEDRQQMQAFCPDAEIAVIPNGVDLEEFPGRAVDPGGHRLVFIGAMDNVANIDAARFFSLEVLPVLQRKYPNATLDLVGNRPVATVLELGDRPGITVTGRVPRMVEPLHRATVCVVPMRTGFGIKNKALEAMAAGIPLVGSDRGLEGLAVDEPLRALRANRPEEYVSAISRLFEDAALRDQLSRSGRSLIEQDYTWEQAGRQYAEVISGKYEAQRHEAHGHEP